MHVYVTWFFKRKNEQISNSVNHKNFFLWPEHNVSRYWRLIRIEFEYIKAKIWDHGNDAPENQFAEHKNET